MFGKSLAAATETGATYHNLCLMHNIVATLSFFSHILRELYWKETPTENSLICYKTGRMPLAVGPILKLLIQSMTAVTTPDHLTLHFPSGSGIPAVTLRCQVMSAME